MEFMNLTPLAPVSDRLSGPLAVPAAPLLKNHLPSSVLAWPAWARALAVAPALVLLWVAVAWALTTVAPL